MNTYSILSYVKLLSVVALILYMVYEPSSGFTLYTSTGILIYLTACAVISIFIKLCKSTKPDEKKKINQAIVRRVVVAVVAICGVFYLDFVDDKGKEKLSELAHNIQNSCNELGRCPEHPDDWSKSMRYQHIFISRGTKFHMYYSSTPKDFYIYINYGPDMKYKYSGGVGLELTKGRSL